MTSDKRSDRGCRPLTESRIVAARRLAADHPDMPRKDLAGIFGVTQADLNAILSGHTWNYQHV